MSTTVRSALVVTPIPDKVALRSHMRHMRRSVGDPAARSLRIWDRVCAHPAVIEAHVVMAFTSIAGEPDCRPFIEWCRAQGKQVVVPEHDPDPAEVDVVVVPGLAFSAAGDRLGQGGGWYDRFLAKVERPRCLLIGVAFAVQLVDVLPRESHDVRMDIVVTDR